MRSLDQEEIKGIALLYTKINSKPGDSVTQLYDRYASAIETICEIEAKAREDRIAKSGIKL